MGYLEKTEDLLWKDECQPLTQEQMTEIKSQFHPSNTANVNIVPYHIYDEDEHIVGEWRETIDGVKKKKSVYQKTIKMTFNTTNMYQFSSDCIVTKIVGTMIWNNNTSSLSLNAAFSASDMVGITINSNIVKGISTNPSAYLGMTIYGTFEYIKSTDEWQPV